MKRYFSLFMVTLFAIILTLSSFILRLSLPSEQKRVIKIVNFPPGINFHQIAGKLEEEGLIKGVQDFILLGKLTGMATRIKAGEYLLTSTMSPLEVFYQLMKGEQLIEYITIPEGFNLFQISSLLGELNLIDEKIFIPKTFDLAFISSLGVEGESLEGYLFPDTYRFIKGMGEENILRRMVFRFNQIYGEKYQEQAERLGLTRREVIILASMVEKETPTPWEKPLVAAVFLNRLKRGMKLQSDPTVIYALKKFEGKLTKEDLINTKSPYNTYRYFGLPPDPIANPGEDSIKAVLYPAKVDYLYFVSKNDGTHHFSRTLEEHNLAVEKYRKGNSVNITVKN